MWWWVARGVVPLVCVASALGVFLLTQPDFIEAQDSAKDLSSAMAFLLAAPIVLLLAPCHDSDLIASSRVDILLPQVRTFAGCLCVGALAFAVNFCLAFARTAGGGMYLLYVVTVVCIVLLPFFYRLPFWRVAVAVFLSVPAAASFHLANFF